MSEVLKLIALHVKDVGFGPCVPKTVVLQWHPLPSAGSSWAECPNFFGIMGCYDCPMLLPQSLWIRFGAPVFALGFAPGAGEHLARPGLVSGPSPLTPSHRATWGSHRFLECPSC